MIIYRNCALIYKSNIDMKDKLSIFRCLFTCIPYQFESRAIEIFVHVVNKYMI